MSDVDWEELRRELRETVDSVVSRFATEGEGGREVTVRQEDEVLDRWSYRWPDGITERYDRAKWFRVTGPSGEARVLLAHTTRKVRAEPLQRWIVFAQMGNEQSQTFYPWTEFVETGDGSYAAVIPNPSRPRAALSDGDPLPTRFAGARVERTDTLYDSVKDGPSLRLVVEEDDAEAMIRHGYWVAEIRKRFRG